MKILAVHAGGFPRIGDRHEQQGLRAVQGAFDRGELTEEKLVDAQNEMVREALASQSKAGLDLVSDGQVRWPDPVSHIMGKLEGVRLGGLIRYFDTDTYFRQPHITGIISAKGDLSEEGFRFARAISPRPVTASLTGPFTLSRLSLPGGPCHTVADIMKALVPILAGEVLQLAEAGANHIIIDEPYLSRDPGGISMVEDSLEVLGGQKAAAKLWLRLSFGDFAPLYGLLQKLPVDGLILDFTCSPGLADAVSSQGSDLPVGLGLVDSRNTRMESPLKTAREAERLMKRMHAGEAWLMASNGVEFLPRNRAIEKLGLLAKIRDILNGKSAKKTAPGRGRTGKRAGHSKKSGKVRRSRGVSRRRGAGKPVRRRGRRRP